VPENIASQSRNVNGSVVGTEVIEQDVAESTKAKFKLVIGEEPHESTDFSKEAPTHPPSLPNLSIGP